MKPNQRKPTPAWWKAAEEYKRHAFDWMGVCTFTEQDAIDQYMAETFGGEHLFSYTRRNEDGKYNGYAVGKHWQGVMVKYYIQDIVDGNFCKAEYGEVSFDGTELSIEYTNSPEIFENIQPTTWFPFATMLQERRSKQQ